MPAHGSDAVLYAELYRPHELVGGHLLVGDLPRLVHPPVSHLALLLPGGRGTEARVRPGVARSGRGADIWNIGAFTVTPSLSTKYFQPEMPDMVKQFLVGCPENM